MSVEGIRFGVYAPTFGPDPRHAARAARETGFAGLQFDANSAALDVTTLTGSGRRLGRRAEWNHAVHDLQERDRHHAFMIAIPDAV